MFSFKNVFRHTIVTNASKRSSIQSRNQDCSCHCLSLSEKISRKIPVMREVFAFSFPLWIVFTEGFRTNRNPVNTKSATESTA